MKPPCTGAHNNKLLIICLLSVFTAITRLEAQRYAPVRTWPAEVNSRLESFLDSTVDITGRKVAVFDCDGTVFGQVPYYLADEALYRYADKVLKQRDDDVAREKLAILSRMVDNGDNVGKIYVEDRVHFLSGLSPQNIELIGYDCYHSSYKDKFYPEMKELIANLKKYGFEVWILTASPELLYQKFVSEVLEIPVNNILGVKSVIKNGITTGEVIPPIPQDDGKAGTIETFIKTKPLIVGGNSRGDMDMLNESAGLKIVVNPDDITVRGPDDGEMHGYTVKSYWENHGALIVRCQDVTDPDISFHTTGYKIKHNLPNP